MKIENIVLVIIGAGSLAGLFLLWQNIKKTSRPMKVKKDDDDIDKITFA